MSQRLKTDDCFSHKAILIRSLVCNRTKRVPGKICPSTPFKTILAGTCDEAFQDYAPSPFLRLRAPRRYSTQLMSFMRGGECDD